MTTYEITPDRTVAPSADVHYHANSVDAIYSIARTIAHDANVSGPVTVSGTYVTVGNVLVARVRSVAPWYSMATDGWVRTDTDYRTVPVR